MCRAGVAATLVRPSPQRWRTRLIALRILLLVVLGLLIIRPPAGRGGGIVEVTASQEDLARARAFVRRSTVPPAPIELELLAGLAGDGPLFAVRPELRPPLRVRAPASALAARNGAVDWQLRGRPGDTLSVRISDAGGPLDSARVSLDSAGRAAGAFRVHPVRSGWHAWVVAAAGVRLLAGSWVGPADTVRALVVPGSAPLEGREVARALERGGLATVLATTLGRGLRLGDAPAGIPETVAAMDAWDVIVVLAGVRITARQAVALEDFVQSGGGLLLAGPAAAALPLVAVGDRQNIDAAAIAWSAPAEIEPLPAVGTSVPATMLPASSHGAAKVGDRDLMALGVRGRGRWAVLGLEETWRWSLQAGRNAELSRFWVSLANWLAGGMRAPFSLTVEPGTAPPGVAVEVLLTALDQTAHRPDSLLLERPGGESESLPLAWEADRGVARFMADSAGDHRLRLPGDGAARTGHRADPDAAPAPDAWARLAMLADRSGGALVSSDSIDVITRRMGNGGASRVLVLAVITTLVFAEWIWRRLHGRA